MTDKHNLDYFRSKGILPFQAEAVIKILESKDKPYWQVISPVGTGKTHVATVIANEIMKDADKRILVLAPAALLSYWHSELSRNAAGYTSMIVDRKTYLEMESEVPEGESPWPNNAIIVMSLDLAKRNDMAEKLTGVEWELAIFDESHLLTGKRKKLFKQMTSSGAIHRCLLLTCIKSSILSGVETIIIDKSEVVDWEQRPIYSSIKEIINEISYKRTEEEFTFLNQLHDFTNQLSNQWSYGKLQGTVLLKAGLSSIYSAEMILRRLQDKWRSIRNKMIHNLPLVNEDIEGIEKQFSSFADELGISQESTYSTDIQPHEFLTLYQKLEKLLSQVEEISTDSKFDALVTRLRSYLDFDVEDNPMICICSSLTNTAQYLSSCLRSQGIKVEVHTLTGSLTQTVREGAIRAFRGQGGIIIATDLALEGITLESVDECINYDIPSNPNIFEQRWVRFLRAGRQTDFKMDVLLDRSKVFPWENDILKIIDTYVEPEEDE